ncbi:uracil-DNA glycosylase family protein [Coprobacter sp.]
MNNLDIIPVESHPLKPFIPQNTQILMLGSFPPKRERWSMDFYYPNLQNDMWRIFGLVFFRDKDYFLNNVKKFDKDRIISFLTLKGIALNDTARSVKRLKDNASDKFLEVIETTDMNALLKQMSMCKAIVTTGQKATETLCTLVSAVAPSVGNFTEFEYRNRKMYFYRMPSSSRAYPKPLPEKAAVYAHMFEELGLL